MQPGLSEYGQELYEYMLDKEYPEEFCRLIARELNTEYTANRMIGYLSHYRKLPMEEVVDEMLAIQSDRDKFRTKHIVEEANAKWNEFLNRGLGEEED